MREPLVLLVATALLIVASTATPINDEVVEDIGENEVLYRSTRDAKKTCRYRKGVWSDCNTETGMRSRSLSLKKGGSECDKEKTVERKCPKKRCRYERGEWSSCNVTINQRTRTDTLRPATDQHEDSSCAQHRTLTKRCLKKDRTGKPKCKYSWRNSDWSECDETSNTVSKKLKLRSGGTECPGERVVTKPCHAKKYQQNKRSRKRGRKQRRRKNRRRFQTKDADHDPKPEQEE